MKSLKKSGAFLLAALLLGAALSGCGKKEPDIAVGFDARTELKAAAAATREDLTARFAASPAASVKDALPGGAYTVAFDAAALDREGEASLSGSLCADDNAGTGILDVTFPLGDNPVSVRLSYAPDFVGLSSPTLLGDETFYGLAPYDFAGQLEGSALASLLQLDIQAMARFDGILASLSQTRQVPDLMNYLDGTFIDSLTLTVRETTLLRGGQELAAYQISDEEKDVHYTVAQGRLFHVSASLLSQTESGEAETVWLEMEFYGDNGQSVQIVAEPYVSLELDFTDGLSANLYTGRGDGVTVSGSWKEDGSLSFSLYEGDVERLALSGALTFSGGGFTYAGYASTAQDIGQTREYDVTVSCTPGATVPVPGQTRNLAEMDEGSLYNLLWTLILRGGLG